VAWRHWRLERDDDLAWLVLDRADQGANTLGRPVLEELHEALGLLAAHPPRGLVLRSGKEAGFVAGADVREFTALEGREEALALVERAHRLLERLEALPFPTVAAIHGYCLGGGLELALACRHRVAADEPTTRLGLPEVRLGIHPGFGGTVRLTRLLPAWQALELMLSGRSLSARQAARLGLVDWAVPRRQLLAAAAALARGEAPARRPPRWRRLAKTVDGTRPARELLARHLARRVRARARPEHYPAPHALLELWRRWGGRWPAMAREEARSVARLLETPTSRELVRLFFLRERLKGLGKGEAAPVRRVHVVGAGVMGGDIAAWCALQGLAVSVQDRRPEALAALVGRARRLFEARLRDRRLVRSALDRLAPDPRGEGAARADLVIEAIVEEREAKRALFRELEGQVPEGALLATNTSSIPLEELAEGLARPERLVGLHFFNPVAKMPLVEVVAGAGTGEEARRRAAAFARAIDRLPLPVRSSPGFLVNRALMPYLLEAVLLLEEGVPARDVDRAAVDFGMPVGPVELADRVGLDICLAVAEHLSEQLLGPRAAPGAAHLPVQLPGALRERVAAGHLGLKSGRGFYRWQGGRPVAPEPPPSTRAPKATPQEDLREVQDRLMLRLVNEAVACLREGVVADADLVDAGLVFGAGFAPFRGGPLRHALAAGRERLRARLAELTEAHGPRFAPDPGWEGPWAAPGGSG